MQNMLQCTLRSSELIPQAGEKLQPDCTSSKHHSYSSMITKKSQIKHYHTPPPPKQNPQTKQRKNQGETPMAAAWLPLPTLKCMYSICSPASALEGETTLHTCRALNAFTQLHVNPPEQSQAGNVLLSAEHLEYSLLPLFDLLQARCWLFFRYVCLDLQHKMLQIPPACTDTGHTCLQMMVSKDLTAKLQSSHGVTGAQSYPSLFFF